MRSLYEAGDLCDGEVVLGSVAQLKTHALAGQLFGRAGDHQVDDLADLSGVLLPSVDLDEGDFEEDSFDSGSHKVQQNHMNLSAVNEHDQLGPGR